MNLNEAAALMLFIKSNYPNSYKDQTKEQAQIVISTWQELFRDYNSELVLKAVKAYINRDDKGFPPTPGMINKILNSYSNIALSPQRAWDLVRNSIDYYDATKNYKALPKDIQEVLGSPRLLQDLHTATGGELQVAASNFMKSYAAYMKNKQFRDSIPENIRMELSKVPCLEIEDAKV